MHHNFSTLGESATTLIASCNKLHGNGDEILAEIHNLKLLSICLLSEIKESSMSSSREEL